jgi:hypothetical protein
MKRAHNGNIGKASVRRNLMTPVVTIVNIADLPLEGVQRGRVNMIRRKRLPLDTGVPGVTCEFSLSIVPEGYFTPRHRHNFDQIRYTLTGVQSTGYGDLGPGEIGYFPEGAHYGPQAQQGECSTLVLQFQGASGEHLLSNEEMNATYQKMMTDGAVFENGIYRGVTAEGRRKNKDSYVAIWEEHEGKKLAFPKPRYRAPVMMQPQCYSWLPDRERPGIETKHLGTFNEMRTGIGFFRLTPGARLAGGRQKDAELRYLVEGACRYGGTEWGEGTYLYIPPGVETEAFVSERGATFFYISLPLVAELAARQQTGASARAAAE